MATVTGSFKLPDGSGNATAFTIRAVDVPNITGSTLVTSRDIETTPNAYGAWSQTLEPGRYRVLMAGTANLVIEVPNTEETYAFIDLIISAIKRFGVTPSPTGERAYYEYSGDPNGVLSAYAGSICIDPDTRQIRISMGDGTGPGTTGTVWQ